MDSGQTKHLQQGGALAATSGGSNEGRLLGHAHNMLDCPHTRFSLQFEQSTQGDVCRLSCLAESQFRLFMVTTTM